MIVDVWVALPPIVEWLFKRLQGHTCTHSAKCKVMVNVVHDSRIWQEMSDVDRPHNAREVVAGGKRRNPERTIKWLRCWSSHLERTYFVARRPIEYRVRNVWHLREFGEGDGSDGMRLTISHGCWNPGLSNGQISHEHARRRGHVPVEDRVPQPEGLKKVSLGLTVRSRGEACYDGGGLGDKKVLRPIAVRGMRIEVPFFPNGDPRGRA